MSDPADKCLTVNNLKKCYRSPTGPVDVFRGITFDLFFGETAAIFGASGSGKTTLLHVLGGLLPANGGRVLFDGQPIENLSRPRRIGFIFQDALLIPEMTVLENLELVRRISEVQSDARETRELLGKVGLKDRLHELPKRLSGGEKQRAAIARALVVRPGLILADEPTGNLDRTMADGVYELLFSLVHEEKIGLVIATHDESLRGKVDRSYRLEGGRLI